LAARPFNFMRFREEKAISHAEKKAEKHNNTTRETIKEI
jgi:hypothetical protein